MNVDAEILSRVGGYLLGQLAGDSLGAGLASEIEIVAPHSFRSTHDVIRVVRDESDRDHQ